MCITKLLFSLAFAVLTIAGFGCCLGRLAHDEAVAQLSFVRFSIDPVSLPLLHPTHSDVLYTSKTVVIIKKTSIF